MRESQVLLENWSFKAVTAEDWKPASVPGCVHMDLLREGEINHPFYGTNEHDLQWIDKVDWEYRTSFNVEDSLFAEEHLQLTFEGLDTYAEVYLNEVKILDADNMFRRWQVDVKRLVRKQGNQLHIRFRSPIKEDLPKLKQLGSPLPAANDQSELGGLGSDRVSIFARKAPYHYGWDWGPRFVTSGIWREVRLLGWSTLCIDDLFIRQDAVSADHASLSALLEVEASLSWSGILEVTCEAGSWSQEVKLKSGKNKLELPLELTKPKLWWSRGLGQAHLYNFTARLVAHDSATPMTDTLTADTQTTDAQERILASASIRTGLRHVKLVRQRDEGGDGVSFYLELNGVPVFAKGANHIPNDSFLTEVTADRYQHEIASAVAANMNMLRVWGGGVYEDRLFYELCDEHGIMVWQDFMFACSMYPWDEPFLLNVEQEAVDNLQRLRNHPSIVLWCGNNEIDSAWAHYIENGGWGWKQDYTPEQQQVIWQGYERIFHEILPEAVSSLVPDLPYWPSSPLVRLTDNEGQHAHPLTNEGDIHYWGVWHNTEPFENYYLKVGRFMSEYGFQSFPAYETVRQFAEEEDLAIESNVMLAHQKNGQGNRLIKQYMDMYMSEPKDFYAFLYMSQVLQAEAMKMAIEAHRHRMPYCMGSLYWQMNDTWPVASWSGIDYYGNWKALHYYVRRSFADTLVAIAPRENPADGVGVYIVRDTLSRVDAWLELSLRDFKGNRLLSRRYRVLVGGNASTFVCGFNLEEELAALEQNAAAGSLMLVAELTDAAEGVELASQFYYFTTFKELSLEAPHISMDVEERGDGTIVTLQTDRLARQVWLQSDQAGQFSDNFFDLIPGKPKTVSFVKRTENETNWLPCTAGRIKVSSLADYMKI